MLSNYVIPGDQVETLKCVRDETKLKSSEGPSDYRAPRTGNGTLAHTHIRLRGIRCLKGWRLPYTTSAHPEAVVRAGKQGVSPIDRASGTRQSPPNALTSRPCHNLLSQAMASPSLSTRCAIVKIQVQLFYRCTPSSPVWFF